MRPELQRDATHHRHHHHSPPPPTPSPPPTEFDSFTVAGVVFVIPVLIVVGARAAWLMAHNFFSEGSSESPRAGLRGQDAARRTAEVSETACSGAQTSES